MQIGLLIGGIPPDRNGGAEQQMLQLAHELGSRGHRVTLFARTYVKRPRLDDRQTYRLVRRPTLGVARARLLADVLLAGLDLARWRSQLDVLLAFQTIANGLVAVWAGGALGLPSAVFIRGNREYREYGPLPAAVYRRASIVLVQSRLIRDDLLAHLAATGRERLAAEVALKTAVIPNGVSLPAAAPPVGEGIVFVGRLVADKGVADLIRAAALLDRARLTIIGDGPERAELQALARSRYVRADFTGWIGPAEVERHLRLARVLALPSYRGDGLPNAVLEAMSLGRPIVASDIAGIPEIVQHGRTGFLVKPGDVDGLAHHLGRLGDDHSLAQRMGAESRSVVEGYAWERVIPMVEAALAGIQVRRAAPSRVGLFRRESDVR